MKRWGRYLLAEILPLYFAGLAVLILLLLGGFMLELLADALSRGVPVQLIARYLLYQLPVAAVYGIPLALLFAALLGLSRLVQDSEMKAARVLGISPGQFLAPIILLGAVISIFSLVNNELIVPWSAQKALEVQKDILLRSPDTVIEERSFFTDALDRSIFIERLLPGGRFEGVTVITPGGSRGPSEVMRAASGTYDEARGVWDLHDISFRVFRNSRLVLDFTAADAVLPVEGLTVAAGSDQDLAFLPLRELLGRLRLDPGRPKPAEWTALHRKIAEPLAATAFAVFALAVAMFSFRRGVPLGLVSVMFLTFVYYATWSVFKLLGAQGTIAPWLAGWAPLLLYSLAGAVLLLFSWRR
jgi:lipopolysaccharide export system permease protein